MTSPDVSTYWISATATTGTSPCASPRRTALTVKTAATIRARPADLSFIGFCMSPSPLLRCTLGTPLQSYPATSRLALCSALVRLFQETALNQPARAPAPGRVGPSAQVGLLDIDQHPGLGIANLVGHRIIRSADARDDPDHGPVGVEASGYLGFATIAIVQFTRLGRFVARHADVDQLVTSRLCDQPTRLFRRKPQLLAVDVVRGDVRRGGAEIFQFKRKHRKFDRRRCGRFGWLFSCLGDCEPCKNHCRSEDESNAAHG